MPEPSNDSEPTPGEWRYNAEPENGWAPPLPPPPAVPAPAGGYYHYDWEFSPAIQPGDEFRFSQPIHYKYDMSGQEIVPLSTPAPSLDAIPLTTEPLYDATGMLPVTAVPEPAPSPLTFQYDATGRLERYQVDEQQQQGGLPTYQYDASGLLPENSFLSSTPLADEDCDIPIIVARRSQEES